MQFILPDNTPNTAPLGAPLSPFTAQLQGPIKQLPPYQASNRFPVVPQPMEGLKRAINFNADFGGCGYWRMLWPEMMLNIYQKAVINGNTAMLLDPHYYVEARSVRIQRQATPIQKEFAKFLRNLSNGTNNFKLIYEIDDIVFREDIPDYNSCKYAFDDPVIASNCRDIMRMCDEITVTCNFMKDYYIEKTGVQNITVIPNYAPRFWLDRFYSSQKIADRFERNKKRPRIGYFGSGTHTDVKRATNLQDDFTHIVDVVNKTRKEFKWVFVGTVPLQLRPLVQSGDIEFHEWTTLMEYPYLIDKVDVSATIAPLTDNTFNRAKSNIKYLEAGCFGIPCVCQDLVTYETAPLKFKTGDDLIDQLRKLFKDKQYYTKQSKSARQYAETMWLEDHLDEYIKLYNVKKDD